jgi:hypothetical protein
VVTLDRNYRSTRPILDASNAVIGLASERFTKDLWTDRPSSQLPRLVTVRDEADQARYVAERVLEQRENGVALKSQAVLFRSSSHSAQLELELARRDIPYVKFGGLKFLEAAHIKDVLSILKWADNPRNRLAGFRDNCFPALARAPPPSSSTPSMRRRARDQSWRRSGCRRRPWRTGRRCCRSFKPSGLRSPIGPPSSRASFAGTSPTLRLFGDAAVRQGETTSPDPVHSFGQRAQAVGRHRVCSVSLPSVVA